MFKKILLLITTICFILPFSNINAKADGQSQPYLITPVLPDNQDKNITNYISISPKSNSLQQGLEYLVTNKTKNKQEINVKVLNAYTSPNGVIQYETTETENSKIIDSKYEMKQYVKAPEKITLQAGESKIVNLMVDIPNIEGTILGGVGFQIEGEKETTKKQGMSFEFKNEINTVYGIVVNFPTNQNYEFKFDEPHVDPMPNYYAIRLPITLDSPLLLKNVDIEYEVLFKGKKLFFSKNTIDFAPMTKTNFSLPFEYNEIKQNEPYNLRGKMTYIDKHGAEQIKEFDLTFVYKVDSDGDNQISKIIKAPIEKAGFPYWLLLLLLPLLAYKLRKGNYVIFSDQSETPIVINKDHADFEKVLPKKVAKNVENLKYAHYYTRKKNKTAKDYQYVYHKTKENQNQNTTE